MNLEHIPSENSSENSFESGVVKVFTPSVSAQNKSTCLSSKKSRTKILSKVLISIISSICIYFAYCELFKSYREIVEAKIQQNEYLIGDIDVSEDFDDYIHTQSIVIHMIELICDESLSLLREIRTLLHKEDIFVETEIDSSAEDEEVGVGGLDHALSLAEFYRESVRDQFPIKIKSRSSTTETYPLSTKEEITQTSIIRSTPIGSPVIGKITSKFGRRTSPFSGKHTFHTGIDISIKSGAPVVASADGLVIFAGRKGGYGKMVHIQHEGGIETIYAHLSNVSTITGRRVKRGQMIGKVGSTGQSTGPHLHYEILQNGRPVNPMPYIQLAAKFKKNKDQNSQLALAEELKKIKTKH